MANTNGELESSSWRWPRRMRRRDSDHALQDFRPSPLNLRCPFETHVFSEEAVLPLLPLYFRTRDRHSTVVEISKSNILEFIKQDTDVSRLNEIHSHMWACGFPLNAEPLHRQVMIKRQLVVTEQADLHLLYHDSVIYIKPLPAYLLCRAIWDQYLTKDTALHMDACGLLLSYTWLLRSPADFALAKDAKLPLLPEDLDWPKWRTFVREFFACIDPNSLHQVNQRYHFGELRLHRINSVYRTIPRLAVSHFVNGYMYEFNRYATFFERAFGWILVVFVWFSLILSAMQVGVGVPELQNKTAYTKAAYGFVVFSIMSVAVLVLFVTLLFGSIFLRNMFAAISFTNKQEKSRRILAENKKIE